MARLISDIDSAQTKNIFAVLQSDTRIFKGYTPQDIEEMCQVLKICQFKK